MKTTCHAPSLNVLFHLLIALGLILVLFTCSADKAPQGSYTADWDSLNQHNEESSWLADAKLGIYFHWGVYSVPAFASEWYPRLMHIKGHPAHQHHLEMYGDPSEFGYHDFVPRFTAEFFNANEWADLFVQVGARFAGPVAEHHDGFSMWASKQTPWNAGSMGPKRDITGELAEAFRQRDIKLITTFHHARHLQRYKDDLENQFKIENKNQQFRHSHYPFIEGWPPTSEDKKLRQLYGNMPEGKWLEQMWLGKLKEVIDKYQPDIIWFDSWLDQVPEEYRQKFAAYYLNRADEWGKEVVIVRKQNDMPLDMSIIDMEKSRMPGMNKRLWMTDDTISKGSWCYTSTLTIKPAVDVLHSFIDIVSKNGVLLLNISPMADGSIPKDQKSVLLEIGDWMKTYGEAIYETRPWLTFGEGPTKEPDGGFSDHAKFLHVKYSDKDIRYTAKGSTIYAFVMGWPGAKKKVKMTAFADAGIEITNVTVLDSDESVKWKQSKSGLTVSTPTEKLNDIALVFKIETK